MKKNLPIYELKINLNEDAIVSGVALVEDPAIESNFFAFNQEQFVKPGAEESQSEFIKRCVEYNVGEGKDPSQAVAICYSVWEQEMNEHQEFQESYNDYPQAASDNAKRAIKYKEEKGSDCGTQIGWTRARQLANRENISRDTIARMASFKRHQGNKDVPYDEGCGGIMWDAWGGTEGVEWAIRKLDQIEREKLSNQNFSSNDEKMELIGAAMIPDKLIYRRDPNGDEYQVYFTKETIREIAQQYFKYGFQKNMNLGHTSIPADSYIFQSYIVDKSKGIKSPSNIDAPDGSWIIGVKVENEKVWNDIKLGKVKGFSIEGIFQFINDKFENQDNDEEEVYELLNQINTLINKIKNK